MDTLPVPIAHVALVDTETGFPVLIQRAHLDLIRRRGGSLTHTLAEPANVVEAGPDWLTLQAATDELVERDDLLTASAARARIVRAIEAGRLTTNNLNGHARRIEPKAWARWLLDRVKDSDADDEWAKGKDDPDDIEARKERVRNARYARDARDDED